MIARRHLMGAGLGGLALAAGGRVQAQPQAAEEWPSRNVTILVPFAPGSSSDIIARAMAQQMQAALGKPVTVENRPGATGEIGARQVIRSAPDGYTLMHAPLSTWAINVALRPNLAYDPVTQLTRITQTVRTPNVLVVHPGSIPATDFPGVVAWLKANGGRASYSTSGAGSSDHLTMEMFKQVTGTEQAHVPFTGGGPATTALLAGTVQLSFQNLGSIAPQIRDGRVRPILITSETRSRLLPEVPTAVELGLRDFVVYSWQGFGGPPGMAPALLARVHAAAVAALRHEDSRTRLEELGFEVVANAPDQFAAFQEAEIARWKRVVQAGGITAD
ncbi:tripartite tricarboxylate transporter substrate binding protein [Siccirubricoccus sp. KC 17139]|uniref:Tripartite tricarboxylate transporter substrate binding protein n=1 Tax=Siccirubricoccus soli TaxID=2899147 RepID=A0ABT1D545_9PROT|nr:tripartite tricarboxylate transporter substrate binding protein [Siccirubricoccus soli]MCO6416747.1 tripartite tricarboxylate transporter substrate binding protein [Siccirubricoccus soli]MCP2682882.1 tripartite tricarboxylate transporter substrate binding protein [Siccirubricoccus soli]